MAFKVTMRVLRRSALSALVVRVRSSFAMSTVALCAACVLTRQHYLLDVVAGLVVGGVAVTLVDVARSWFEEAARLSPYTVHSVESETAE